MNSRGPCWAWPSWLIDFHHWWCRKSVTQKTTLLMRFCLVHIDGCYVVCICWWLHGLYLLMVTWLLYIDDYMACTCWWLHDLYSLMATWLVLIDGYMPCTYWWIHGLYLLMATWSVLIDGYMVCTCWWLHGLYLLMATWLIVLIDDLYLI